MRASGRRPSKTAAKSTISSWRGLNWHCERGSGDGVVEGRVDSGPIATVRGIQQAGAHLASGIAQCPTHLLVPLSLNEQGMGRQ
jgi:hypothetical protein